VGQYPRNEEGKKAKILTWGFWLGWAIGTLSWDIFHEAYSSHFPIIEKMEE